MNFENFKKIINNFFKLFIPTKRVQFWRVNGKFHRVEGPAIISANGSEQWYLNGKAHRIGGPAVIDDVGNKLWYLNGILHREDGPAAEYVDGRKDWFYEGKSMTEEEYNSLRLDKKIPKAKIKKKIAI